MKQDNLREWLAEAVDGLGWGSYVEIRLENESGQLMTARQIASLLPKDDKLGCSRYRCTTIIGGVRIGRR